MARQRNARHRPSSKQSYLETFYPIFSIAKVFGAFPFWVQSKYGSTEITVSSSCVVVYSYTLLLCSTISQATAWWIRSSFARPVRAWYHGLRILLSAVLNYRFLSDRCRVCKVLQKLHRLQIDLPKYYIGLPALTLTTALVLFLEQVLHGGNITALLLMIIQDMIPLIAAVYHGFLYCFQVRVLHRGVQNLNANLQQLIHEPAKSAANLTLRPLIRSYLSLKTVCNDFNEVFGQQILLSSTASCLDITYCFYICFVTKGAYNLALNFLWSTLCLVPEIAVMLTSQQVENAFMETNALSMEILMQKKLPKEMKKEAQELSLQIKQLPLRLSARGFFNLNGQQLRMAVSTYITYTIILIQITPQ